MKGHFSPALAIQAVALVPNAGRLRPWRMYALWNAKDQVDT